MAGWDLKSGAIKEYAVSEDRIWSLFNFVFSDSSRKRNTYKYGLIKAILDNAFNGQISTEGVFYTCENIFEHFAKNYWNLISNMVAHLSGIEVMIKSLVRYISLWKIFRSVRIGIGIRLRTLRLVIVRQ